MRVHQAVDVEARRRGRFTGRDFAGSRVLLLDVLEGFALVSERERARARAVAREPAGERRLLRELLLALAGDGSQQVADHADAGGRELTEAASERDVLGDDLLFGVLGADGLEAAVATADEVDLEFTDLPGGSGVVAGVGDDQLDTIERFAQHLSGLHDERTVSPDTGTLGDLLVQSAGVVPVFTDLSLEDLLGALVVLADAVDQLLHEGDALGQLVDDELLRLVVVARAAALGGRVLDGDGAVLVERDDRTLVCGQFGGAAGLAGDLAGGRLLRDGLPGGAGLLGGFGHGSEPLPRAIYSHLENSNHWNLNSVDLHNEVRDDNRLFLKK